MHYTAALTYTLVIIAVCGKSSEAHQDTGRGALHIELAPQRYNLLHRTAKVPYYLQSISQPKLDPRGLYLPKRTPAPDPVIPEGLDLLPFDILRRSFLQSMRASTRAAQKKHQMVDLMSAGK